MAKTILEALWTDRQQAVETAIELLKSNYAEDKTIADKSSFMTLKNQISKSESRIRDLTEMRMDGEITKAEYIQMRKAEEENISECQIRLSSQNDDKEIVDNLDEQLKNIRGLLEEMIDFSGNIIDEEILERLVARITPIQNGTFRWVLNLLGDGGGNHLMCSVKGRKNNPSFLGDLSDSLPSFQTSSIGIDIQDTTCFLIISWYNTSINHA